MERKTFQLRGYTITLDDVKKIYQRLSSYNTQRGHQEVDRYVKLADMTDEDFLREKQQIRDHAFKIAITVGGQDASTLDDDSDKIFTSPSLPAHIGHVAMTNMLRGSNRRPPNWFSVNLDFTMQSLVDSASNVSSPTLNYSRLEIEGVDDAWMATIKAHVFDVLEPKRNRRRLLHTGHIYDLGLWFLAAPIAFYFCLKASSWINRVSPHEFVSALMYLYVGILTLFVYRGLFHYTKWAFPLVELKEDKSPTSIHRAIWWALFLGIVGKAIYDLAALGVFK